MDFERFVYNAGKKVGIKTERAEEARKEAVVNAAVAANLNHPRWQ